MKDKRIKKKILACLLCLTLSVAGFFVLPANVFATENNETNSDEIDKKEDAKDTELETNSDKSTESEKEKNVDEESQADEDATDGNINNDEDYSIKYVTEKFSDEKRNLKNITSDHDVLACMYMASKLDIMSEPSYDSQPTVTVPTGTTIKLVDVEIINEYGTNVIWYKVSTLYKGNTYTGYTTREEFAIADEDFLDWESDIKEKLNNKSVRNMFRLFALPSPRGTNYQDVEQFPDEYQAALTSLKAAHPNWIFVRYDTGLNWQSAIDNEVGGGKSVVSKSFYDYHKEGQAEPNWFYANEDTLKWYMDPRSWLDEQHIFQFELLSYNSSYHTETALDSFLSSTFMASAKNGATQYAPGTSQTYANIFYQVGAELGVSPFHLASRVYQEQGAGTSPLISGAYPGYEGYYNYFNINVPSGTNEYKYTTGLTYAKNQGWNTAYKSIRGGSSTISKKYIGAGQDTGYLQKFNVTSTNRYSHQYMTNISAPSSEAVTTYKLYKGAGSIDSPFVFKIPVFNNMPGTACAKPTSTTHVVLKLPSGYDNTVYVDGVAKSGVSRNGQYIIDMKNTSARNAVVYKYNSSGVPVGMHVWTISYKDNNYYEVDEEELSDMLSYNGFSIRISGKSGIRFKSGIPVDLRNKLTTTGVDGYKLTEYGTLIMNKSNMSDYPFVYGGQKLNTAKAYGGGTDNIFATTDGRDIYTAVLTGIPTDQYKTELAFRSYAVLEKNGEKSIVYGPIQSRSIYNLADQYIKLGTYSSDSSQYKYLQSILSNAK